MNSKKSVFGKYLMRYSNSSSDALSDMFQNRLRHIPPILRTASKAVAFLHCRSEYLDRILERIPFVQSFVRFLAGNAELVSRSPETISATDVHYAPLQMNKFAFDLVVIGSGPGGSIAALRAAESGLKVLVLEIGGAFSPGDIEHHSLVQTELQFKNGGLNFIWGTKPVLFAEGCTLGGGSEVNSGLYHRLVGTHRANILKSVEATEEEWAKFEELVEHELSIQKSPSSNEPKLGLIAGAKRLGLVHEEIPRWRTYGPSEKHQGMQETYLKKALSLGVQILTRAPVKKLLPQTDHIDIQLGGIYSKIKIRASNVVIAAGTIETPRLLNRSKISKGNFELNFHPMIRFVSAQEVDLNDGDLFPSWQAWTPDHRLKYGYSVSTFPYLAATLRSLGERSHFSGEQFKKMAAYFASFTLQDSRVNLNRFGKALIPTIRWGIKDKGSIKCASNQLAELLREGEAIEVWPKKGISPITTVHLFGSIPLGRTELIDEFGRLRVDSRIRISDASLMPHAPWGNPQGPIMVLCELISERCLRDA